MGNVERGTATKFYHVHQSVIQEVRTPDQDQDYSLATGNADTPAAVCSSPQLHLDLFLVFTFFYSVLQKSFQLEAYSVTRSFPLTHDNICCLVFFSYTRFFGYKWWYPRLLALGNIITCSIIMYLLVHSLYYVWHLELSSCCRWEFLPSLTFRNSSQICWAFWSIYNKRTLLVQNCLWKQTLIKQFIYPQHFT